jgi:hypothetical protein
MRASGAESHFSVKPASGKSEVENTSLAHQVSEKPVYGQIALSVRYPRSQ